MHFDYRTQNHEHVSETAPEEAKRPSHLWMLLTATNERAMDVETKDIRGGKRQVFYRAHEFSCRYECLRRSSVETKKCKSLVEVWRHCGHGVQRKRNKRHTLTQINNDVTVKHTHLVDDCDREKMCPTRRIDTIMRRSVLARLSFMHMHSWAIHWFHRSSLSRRSRSGLVPLCHSKGSCVAFSHHMEAVSCVLNMNRCLC